jgi:hypothetical protein
MILLIIYYVILFDRYANLWTYLVRKNIQIDILGMQIQYIRLYALKNNFCKNVIFLILKFKHVLVSEDKIQKRTSLANTIYLGINTEDVIATYSTGMKNGFYLVNVGQFHNVWNKNEDRYCLSACLIDSRTSYRLNFNELQQRLKGYINE